MNRIQCYCSLEELNQDNENGAGLDATVLARFILPASEYLSREIGAFQPVAETQKLSARGDVLFTPPVLRLTGPLSNKGTILAVEQVVLRATAGSSQPFWHNGPFLRIDAASGAIVWSNEVDSIEIPAVWGLYEQAQATGATLAAELNVSAETLSVANGSLLSPGTVLKIGDEWLFARDYGAVSANLTTLSGALDASSEVIALTSGAAVNVGEVIKIGFELMKVLDIQGNNGFVVRGWNKSKKASHNSGAQVGALRTFAVTRAVNGSTAATHASGTAIARMVTPSDIHYLTRQIATLMMRKSQGGYAGRLANAESGESFYMHEFPREPIERIRENYYIPAVR